MAENLEEGEVVHLANIWLKWATAYCILNSYQSTQMNMTKGIDTDLDGIIDIPITPNQGTVLAGMDNSTVKDTFNLLSKRNM